MKAVICLDDPFKTEPTPDELEAYWRQQLDGIPAITEYSFTRKFSPATLDEIAADNEIILGGYIADNMYTEEFFTRHPKLRYVESFAHGFGKFDRQAAKNHNVTFTNTIYGDHTIAEFAMSLLLTICHHVESESVHYSDLLDSKTSIRSVKGVVTKQIELYQKTMGIIGLGHIGLCMAQMARGFGMNVIAYSRHQKEGDAYSFIEQVSLDEVLRRSDVISIHCSLTDQTKNLLDRENIAKMKEGAILINTARGAIVDEEALKEALDSGHLYAAGLDVVCGEPLSEKTPIFDCDNALITGHIAWATAESRYRTVRVAIQNLRNWLAGEPTSVI